MRLADVIGVEVLARDDPVGPGLGIQIPRVDHPRLQRCPDAGEDRSPGVHGGAGGAEGGDDALPQRQEHGVAGVVHRAGEIGHDRGVEVGGHDVDAEILAPTQFGHGVRGDRAHGGRWQVGGDREPRGLREPTHVVVRHERRVLIHTGHADRGLERMQTAVAERGDDDRACPRGQRGA